MTSVFPAKISPPIMSHFSYIHGNLATDDFATLLRRRVSTVLY
jgi:hypothetical protein